MKFLWKKVNPHTPIKESVAHVHAHACMELIPQWRIQQIAWSEGHVSQRCTWDGNTLFTNHNNFHRHGLLTNSEPDEVLQLLHSWHLVFHYCWISDWDLVCCFKVITHKLTTWVKWQNLLWTSVIITFVIKITDQMAKYFLCKQKAKTCQTLKILRHF